MTQAQTSAPAPATDVKPWPALFALVIGFFMILIDLTIVTVATPSISSDLDASYNKVIWVSSAYMLAYAVPVLITGRLGDRFGSKYIYMAGLIVFSLASLWCGLTGSVEMLIVARVAQGLGASMMTPQTMAIITRIFPPAQRGQAMAVWGATAGVAMVVGPILGGVLTDAFGWEWIFFVNVPIGIVAFLAALRFVPVLPTHEHRFDWLGVALSGVGLFLLAYGVQQGHQEDWDTGIIAMIAGGLVFLVVFVLWQAANKQEPLVPLGLFKDRNFSVSNLAITTMGAVGASFGYPIILYAEAVRGDSPTQAALLLFPMAIMSILLAKVVGNLVDNVHPRLVVGFGFLCNVVGFFWLATQLQPDVAVWRIVLPMIVVGIGQAFVWAPTAATATRNLPMHLAGAGAGVYNATRQVGSVLGSAAIAVLLDARLAHYLPGASSTGETGADRIGDAHVAQLFSDAMRDAAYLPAVVTLLGLVFVVFYEKPKHSGYAAGH
ncbi:MAG: DHA2 family efflux MFS transporter permease subunit [Nocardioides sp.]